MRRLVVLQAPLIEISATEIRRRVGARLGVSYFVPVAVAEFIAKQQLLSRADWLANQRPMELGNAIFYLLLASKAA